MVACPSAILLPVAGFVCACILMRYQEEYQVCVLKNYPDKDWLRAWIRIMESLTFAYSISYFFFLSRPAESIITINCVIFEIINVLFILSGIFALGMKSESKCVDTTFGSTVTGMSFLLLFQGIIGLVVHFYFYRQYS